jgi:hypothetical protein
VTAVRILDKDSPDCPQFVPLVKETKKHFEIGEVSADKAYASLENFEEVAACGGQAYIAFKSNNTGAAGGAFEKAFHYFQFNQEEYMVHYHKRSNAASTFSAIKRKFGDSVMSKNDVAMVNEVLFKILCHNLTCLIQVQVVNGLLNAIHDWSKVAPGGASPVVGADLGELRYFRLATTPSSSAFPAVPFVTTVAEAVRAFLTIVFNQHLSIFTTQPRYAKLRVMAEPIRSLNSSRLQGRKRNVQCSSDGCSGGGERYAGLAS